MIPQTLGQDLIAYRRDFHKYAESGWTEFRTSAIVAKTLSELGYTIKLGREIIHEESVMGRPADIQSHQDRAVAQGADPAWIQKMDGYTGVVGILDTGKPGPVVAVRFDIDANDADEAKDPKHRPCAENFASVNPRVMHACGHDGHTAVGLGVARMLAAQKDALAGKIKLIFQPAEEGVRGGKAMADSGIVDDVDYIFSGHLGIGAPFGTVYASTAGFLSSTKFDVTFTGKSAHAGVAPNEGKNALLAAASATVMLHAIPPHQDGPTRINVGVLNAGMGRNVIAANALMKLETRGGTNAINDYVFEAAERIIKHAAGMQDVSYTIEKMGYATGCSCDPEMIAVARECALATEGIREVPDVPADMGGSEDVTWLIRAVQARGGKGTYMIIGTDIAAGHHNGFFDINEDILPIAVELFVKMIEKLLGA